MKENFEEEECKVSDKSSSKMAKDTKDSS